MADTMADTGVATGVGTVGGDQAGVGDGVATLTGLVTNTVVHIITIITDTRISKRPWLLLLPWIMRDVRFIDKVSNSKNHSLSCGTSREGRREWVQP